MIKNLFLSEIMYLLKDIVLEINVEIRIIKKNFNFQSSKL